MVNFMSNITTFLTTSQYAFVAYIVLSVIIVATASTLLVRKFGIKIISVTESILVFIKDTLASLDFKSNNVNDVISALLQGILFALAINTDGDNATKVRDSLTYIKNISAQLNVTLTDAELSIITVVLTSTFTFLSAINVKSTSLKYKKLEKVSAKYGIVLSRQITEEEYMVILAKQVK